MVFIGFSHGFHMVFTWFSNVFHSLKDVLNVAVAFNSFAVRNLLEIDEIVSYAGIESLLTEEKKEHYKHHVRIFIYIHIFIYLYYLQLYHGTAPLHAEVMFPPCKYLNLQMAQSHPQPPRSPRLVQQGMNTTLQGSLEKKGSASEYN